MKVLLLSNYLIDRQQSMLRFATIMEQELRSKGCEVRVIHPKVYLGGIKTFSSGLDKWLGYFDKFVIFPFTLRRASKWADIIHICDHSNAMYVKEVISRPHLVTCHDLLAVRSALGEFPENPVRWTGKQFQKMILEGLKQSRFVVCDSYATQSDLIRIGLIAPDLTRVIYLGLNYHFSKMEPNEARKRVSASGIDLNRPYLIHVGSDVWYKNRFAVLKIFCSLSAYPHLKDLNLIFVGSPLSNEMQDFASSNNLTSRIFHLTNVENEDLRALYSLASALVFPSLIEGFGWPLLEAHACGCPVFTSNSAPMNEVGGEAALYIDPVQPDSAAEAIGNQWDDWDSMIQKGYENASRFKTSFMIEEYIDIYRYLIECRQP